MDVDYSIMFLGAWSYFYWKEYIYIYIHKISLAVKWRQASYVIAVLLQNNEDNIAICPWE